MLIPGNTLATTLKDGSTLKITEETNYPWDGNIKITVNQASSKPFSVFMRIPGWASAAKILVNGKPFNGKIASGEYAEVKGNWKAGDKIELMLPMEAKLIEANPLVEETRGQVTVKRGPIVYCLESIDLPKDQKVFSLALPVKAKFKPTMIKMVNSDIMQLEGNAQVIETNDWKNKLYKEVSQKELVTVPIKLVPYYSWGTGDIRK